jgi:hypothetical protein
MTDEYEENILDLQFFDKSSKREIMPTASLFKDTQVRDHDLAEYEKDGEKKTGIMYMDSEGMEIMSADFKDFESFDMGDETWYTGSASISVSNQRQVQPCQHLSGLAATMMIVMKSVYGRHRVREYYGRLSND